MAQRDKTWESAWRSALEDKKMAPPEDAWDNISNELDKSRRRSMLPIWWAAAAISIIAVAGVLLTERIPADEHSTEAFQVEVDRHEEDRAGANVVPENPATKKSKTGDNIIPVEDHHVASTAGVGKKEIPGTVEKTGNFESAGQNVVYNFVPGLVEGIKAVASDLKLPKVGEIWGVPMPYNANRKRKALNWYAGLDLSTGSSSVVADGSAGADEMMPLMNSFSGADKASADNRSSNASSSRTYGITVGKKITNRIVLESGISYIRLSNTGTANIAIASAAGREAFNYNAIRSETNIMTTNTPYAVENVHQFISIPIKAGYIFLDRQWKLSVNTGVAGDYFIKTHTADLSGDLQMYEANPSTDPLWNSMAMSVIGEMNVSRQLGRHYLLAITPQMRKSVNDLSNTRTELRPFIFQVGIQVKYQF